MQAGSTALAAPDAGRDLPLLFRLAAGGRRVLGAHGTRLLHRSAIATPLRGALRRAAPAGMSMVEVCGGRLRGTRMLVDLSCEKYYWLGTHEEPVQEWLAAKVQSGSTVYDIGAHAGFFTLLCSSLAGPNGRVHAFEPCVENAERLRANLRANGPANVDVHAVAVSDKVGQAVFVTDASTLQGRLADAGVASGPRVLTTTVDTCVEGGMRPPELMKIDVEGHEGAVIRGAARAIATYRPLLLVEVHSAAAGREVAAALSCAYEFRDVKSGRIAAYPPPAGHYAARPAGA